MTDKTNNDYERIVIEKIPLIDVRAPVEFANGAFPNAVNLPIMDDEERRLVGICYKERGSDEAVKLGHQLVCGEKKQTRIDGWLSFIDSRPDSMIYCFRGGLRSQISQKWIYGTSGKEVLRLEGGYKAFRNFLISALEPSQQKSTPILLGGYTGSGKTTILKNLKNAVDLEGIANHRGSSFGSYITPQPSQIDFENRLAYALIEHRHRGERYIVLEDESSHIGKSFIPKPLYEYFKTGHFVIVDIPFEERVHNVLNEYVIESQGDYIKAYGEQGLSNWHDYISCSIERLKKRLGTERYKCISDYFELACKEQINSGEIKFHKNWIGILLKEYYDPMYYYQLKEISSRILLKGTTEEVFKYLEEM